MPEIILFGATGYTGRNTAEAMVARGLRPVLAGRNPEKLKRLSAQLGGLKTVIADTDDYSKLTDAAKGGGLIVSTVGPFTAYGDAALRAAIEAGAHYIDCAGESGFIRRVFDEYGPAASAKGISMITACGYDFVPGNCAAAAALEQAGSDAVRVDVGYFITGRDMMHPSQGTSASIRLAVTEPGKIWRGGALKETYGASGLRKFKINSRNLNSVLLPTSESYSLPELYSSLRDVNVYLGWFGRYSPLVRAAAAGAAGFMKIPGGRGLLRRILSLVPGSSGEGPDKDKRSLTGSHIIAEAYNSDGRLLSRVDMTGVNAYDFTFEFLASAAEMVVRGRLQKTGAVGPVEAFGLKRVIGACEESGIGLFAAS